MKRLVTAPGVIAESHCMVTGSAVVNGKTVYWEFSPMFGPSFTDSEGEILDCQPGPRSAAWKAWQAWYEELCNDTNEARRIGMLEPKP